MTDVSDSADGIGSTDTLPVAPDSLFSDAQTASSIVGPATQVANAIDTQAAAAPTSTSTSSTGIIAWIEALPAEISAGVPNWILIGVGIILALGALLISQRKNVTQVVATAAQVAA